MKGSSPLPRDWFKSPHSIAFRPSDTPPFGCSLQCLQNKKYEVTPESIWQHHVDEDRGHYYNQDIRGDFNVDLRGENRQGQHNEMLHFSQEDQMVTPMNNVIIDGKSEQNTTAKKTGERKQIQNGLQGNGDKRMRRCAEEQKSGDGQSRAVEKGLRSISKRAFAYMRSLKISTYNEIAEKLIMEMFHHPDQQLSIGMDAIYQSQQGQQHSQKYLGQVARRMLKKSTEQQNIKRRVYDALNVLIALGLLHKQNHLIRYFPSKEQLARQAANEKQMVYLTKALALRQFNLRQKQTKLNELKLKGMSIQTLIYRNQNQHYDASQIIQFPFIITSLTHFKDQCEPRWSICSEEIELHSADDIIPLGDIDSIIVLRPSLENDSFNFQT